jgi:hypothetical protein
MVVTVEPEGHRAISESKTVSSRGLAFQKALEASR